MLLVSPRVEVEFESSGRIGGFGGFGGFGGGVWLEEERGVGVGGWASPPSRHVEPRAPCNSPAIMASGSTQSRVTPYLIYLVFVTTLGPLQFGYHLVSLIAQPVWS